MIYKRNKGKEFPLEMKGYEIPKFNDIKRRKDKISIGNLTYISSGKFVKHYIKSNSDGGLQAGFNY